MGKLWNEVMSILRAPFVGDLDLIHLFLITGAIIIFAIVWALVLSHIRLAAAEVIG